MGWTRTTGRAQAFNVLAVAAAALYSAAVTVVVGTASYRYAIPAVLITLFPLVLYLSPNPRTVFLLGTVFTAPLGLSINFARRVHMGGAGSYAIDVMDFFLVPLLVYLVRDLARGYRSELRLSPISAWWLGLTFLGAFTVLLGPLRQLASFEVLRMVKCWLLFVVIVNECVRVENFRQVVLALVASIAANVAVAALQFFLKRDLGLQALGEASEISTLGANLGVYGSVDSVYRVGGLLGHANLLSAYLALLLPILLGQLFTEHSPRMKLLLAAASAGGLTCLVLTLSRSGWLSFAAAMLVLTAGLFTLPALRRRHTLLKAGLVLSLAVGLAVAAGPIIRRLTESDPGAVDFRREWVGVAWNMVKDQPVFGVGLNSFIYHLLDFAPYDAQRMYDIFGDLWPAVHNIYMLVWSEQGTVGLLLFVGLHLNVFWIGVKSLRYRGLSEKVYMLNLGAMCGILAIAIDGMSSFYVRVPGPARAFWLVIGLLVAAHYWNVRNDAARRRRAAAAAALGTGQPAAPGA